MRKRLRVRTLAACWLFHTYEGILSERAQPGCAQSHEISTSSLASSQCWLQYFLVSSTAHRQAGCAHFSKPRLAIDDYLSLTSSRPYPRHREYPHPPPPSKNNTTRTINMVDISFLPRLDAVQLGGHATRVGNTVEPEVSARCLSKSCRPRMQEVLEIGPARSNPPHGSCARFAQHSKRGQVEVSGVPYGRADSLHYRRRSARFTGL
jgi:hypothetical protein